MASSAQPSSSISDTPQPEADPLSRSATSLKNRYVIIGEVIQGPLLILLWSSAFVAGVIGTKAGTPLLLCCIRFFIAGVILTALALVLRKKWPRGRTLAHTVLAGVFMHAVQFCGFYYGMAHGLGGGVSALIQGLSSMIVVALATFTLGERLTAWQGVGFAVGLVGVAIAIADRLAFSPIAVFSAFVGLAGISVGTYWQKRFVTQVDLVSSTAVQLLASTPLAFLAMLVVENPRINDPLPFIGAVAWVVVINSLVVFLLLNYLLRILPATTVSTLFLAVPATTAVLSWLFAGQTLSIQATLGLFIGGFGAALATYGARSTRKGPTP